MALLREISDFTPRMRMILVDDEDPGLFLDAAQSEAALEAVRSGVLGYPSERASASEIISAVRSITRGETVCTPIVRWKLVEHFSQGRFQMSDISRQNADSRGLTDRQGVASFGSCPPRVDE